MKWYVYYDNINKKQITAFNIFDHDRFRETFSRIASTSLTKDEFAEELKSILMYHFWCKSEYEVLVYPYPAHSLNDPCKKISVYIQVEMNWQAFVDYTWAHREEIQPQ